MKTVCFALGTYWLNRIVSECLLHDRQIRIGTFRKQAQLRVAHFGFIFGGGGGGRGYPPVGRIQDEHSASLPRVIFLTVLIQAFNQGITSSIRGYSFKFLHFLLQQIFFINFTERLVPGSRNILTNCNHHQGNWSSSVMKFTNLTLSWRCM